MGLRKERRAAASSLGKTAGQPRLHDQRMDVAFPADSPRVTEPVRNLVDDLVHHPLRASIRFRKLLGAEECGGADRAAPCAEVL